jgi:Zn-finger nucleic acid-binding protein
MNCPGCGAPMRLEPDEEFLRCDYCKGTYVPDKNDEGVRVLGEPSPLECPVCAKHLSQASLAAHRLLYCESCRGMLVAMDVFVMLIQELRARQEGPGAIQSAADASGLERHIHCPQCGKPMDTHFYEGPGNIIIDDCSHCSLNWLDYGELMRIIRAPDRTYSTW